MPVPYNSVQVQPSPAPSPPPAVGAILIGSAASGGLIGTYPAPTIADNGTDSFAASTVLNLEVTHAPPAGWNMFRAIAPGPIDDDGDDVTNEYWVAVGWPGSAPFTTLASIFASYSDAKEWQQITPGSVFAGLFEGVASDGIETFVIVGRDSLAPGATPVIHTFVSRWAATVQRTVGAGFALGGLFAVAFGGGVWVAVGRNGEIQSSPDGIVWTHRPQPLVGAVYLNGVTYANGQFVVVGQLTPNQVILTSPDGVTWTSQTPASIAASPNTWLSDIAFGNDEFVAVGYDNTNSFAFIVSSPDGIAWTRRSDVFPPGSIDSRFNFCPHIAYFSGIRAFCTTSESGDLLPGLHVSLQGLDQPWSRTFAIGSTQELDNVISPNGAPLASNGRRLVIAGTTFAITRTLNVDTF